MNTNKADLATTSYVLWGGYWEVIDATQLPRPRYGWYSSSLKNFRDDFNPPPVWMEELLPGKLFHWFGAGQAVYRPAGWQCERIFPEGRTAWVLTKTYGKKRNDV